MTKAGLLTEHGTVLNRNITPSLRFWSNGSRKQDRKEKKTRVKLKRKTRGSGEWNEGKQTNIAKNKRHEI